MSSELERIIVIESEEPSRQRLVSVLKEAGYEVSAPRTAQQSLQAVLAFGPDLLILDAEPPQLDCCSLVAELKGSPASQSVRIILLSSGGPAERTRGLDLGADDVLSRPWEPFEFLARVRAQLRVKHMLDEWRDKARLIEEGQQTARSAFSLGRTVKVALIILLLIAAVTASLFFLLYRRTQTETVKTQAAIARLEQGLRTQQKLVEGARKMREEFERTAASSLEQQKQQLERESQDLRARMATAQSEEVAALRRQLDETNVHLRRLEDEGKVAHTIIRLYASSVCLLHVVVAFRDKVTGRRLRFASVDAQGKPEVDGEGNPVLKPDGRGPELRLDAFGTGFLAAPGGRILTNRHVVEPWWKDEDLSPLIEQGVEPAVAQLSAYFPEVSQAFPVTVQKISSETDLALVQGDLGALKLRLLTLDSRKDAAVSGQPVVLLGYPTGLDAILARAGEDTVRAIAESSGGNPTQVMTELAQRKLIRPINTQGHIGDVLPDKLVYDAQTTFGGSGGPLFNVDGKVIGVNFAIVRGFGGSNFAIPIRHAELLLSR
jgi:CheY-like chemotaxis protein